MFRTSISVIETHFTSCPQIQIITFPCPYDRNFFGWLSPYPIFLSFNFTRLLSLFSFLLPVLDLAIRPFPKSHLLFFVALIMLLLQPMPFLFWQALFLTFPFLYVLHGVLCLPMCLFPLRYHLRLYKPLSIL